jgi:hypothetical protein
LIATEFGRSLWGAVLAIVVDLPDEGASAIAMPTAAMRVRLLAANPAALKRLCVKNMLIPCPVIQ